MVKLSVCDEWYLLRHRASQTGGVAVKLLNLVGRRQETEANADASRLHYIHPAKAALPPACCGARVT